MQPFEYANPASVQEAVALLSPKWGQADVLAGGTDLISCMKERLHTPKRVVNIKNIKELGGITKSAEGLRIGALVTMDELAKSADVRGEYKSLSKPPPAFPARKSATWEPWAAICASALAAGISATVWACWA